MQIFFSSFPAPAHEAAGGVAAAGLGKVPLAGGALAAAARHPGRGLAVKARGADVAAWPGRVLAAARARASVGVAGVGAAVTLTLANKRLELVSRDPLPTNEGSPSCCPPPGR